MPVQMVSLLERVEGSVYCLRDFDHELIEGLFGDNELLRYKI